jgi:hypothetical protein
LNWFWIGVAVAVPGVLGLLAAFPLWLRGESIFGNLAGAIVMFGGALALILREHVEIDRATSACLAQGFTCWPDPSAFARYSIYAGIAMVEVIALFSISLTVEARIRRRGYAPEWR